MDKKRLWTSSALIGILILAWAFLAGSSDQTVDDDIGLCDDLPEVVGGYVGRNLLFCQDEQCLRAYEDNQVTNNVCPECGTELNAISVGERRLLPEDTRILRKRYTNAMGETFLVSVVVGGRERRSIHKPQVCLVGQGHAITMQNTMTVPLDGGGELDIMVLDLQRAARTANRAPSMSSFSYWFVSGERTTPHHLQRLFWIAWDGVLLNQRNRWAYVSVGTSRHSESDEHRQRLGEFISELAPLLEDKNGDPPADD